jgi:glycosyltransferase involved in cell wall biosynthesis
MPPPTASVVIPTRARPHYLEVALASIAPQAAEAQAEVLVVDDAGETAAARDLAARFGVRYLAHARPCGLNVARNTGVERSHGELVVFVDDDVRAAPGWLAALIDAAGAHPDTELFTGPIRARIEDHPLRSCGREQPPITTLDLGSSDTRTRYAWGANMAIRRTALERVGPFDVSIEHGGDEQEWQERLAAREHPAVAGALIDDASRRDRAAGDGVALYVAEAVIEHRRAGDDARLRALARVAYTRGRAARRFDARRGRAPSLRGELRTLTACAGHVVRRRCPAGLTMVAHSAGRVREATRGRGRHRATPARQGPPAADATGRADFLSGESGTVAGVDGVSREIRDLAADAAEILSGRRARLRAAARAQPPRRHVLALGVEREEHRALARAARAELLRSRHDVEVHTCAPSGAGKFENLNALLAAHMHSEPDWLLLVDDDVGLPRGFLDRFLFVSERFDLRLAQPAHRLASHAAWSHTRRRPRSLARVVGMVEIGPVTALHRETLATLTPFPPTRMGWGLDAHWGAVARERGWRCGVVDAVALRHRARPVAEGYSSDAAIAEARELLATRPYLDASEARATLERHNRW